MKFEIKRRTLTQAVEEAVKQLAINDLRSFRVGSGIVDTAAVHKLLTESWKLIPPGDRCGP